MAKVVRFVWAHGRLFNLTPLRPLDMALGRPAGKVHRTEPGTKRQGTEAYGYDAEDRLVVERSYDGPRVYVETLYAWSGHQCQSVTYNSTGALVSVGVHLMGPHGLVESRGRTYSDARSHSVYHWKRRRIERVETTSSSLISKSKPRTDVWTVTWSPEGELDKVVSQYVGSPSTLVRYQRPNEKKKKPTKSRPKRSARKR